eukprot:CAMPEP_0181120516 /NCGR_PEP_ID=MMETSP1071-20121207/24198_1 /TAXON_ID=35127 /ORGANISM="Thalassiosira sp., Strain NH16" /LENGTH=420 /DNA_ID=CAMNT_0023205177 /DNA_START=27 /DNA_END=1287 /DNA_ORIENTATION=+
MITTTTNRSSTPPMPPSPSHPTSNSIELHARGPHRRGCVRLSHTQFIITTIFYQPRGGKPGHQRSPPPPPYPRTVSNISDDEAILTTSKSKTTTMNVHHGAVTTAAAEPRQLPPSSQPTTTKTTAMTSLTSRHATTVDTTSALATSVADFVCDQLGKQTASGTPPPPPPQSQSTPAAANGPLTLRTQPRIVSQEPPSPRRRPSTNNAGGRPLDGAPSPPRTLTPRTPSNANNGASSNCSSMSSAVADLASGMFNFRPSTGNNAGHNNSHHGSSSGHHSAPIISGTAAAVLALQSTFHDDDAHTAPAIVSNSGSLDAAATGLGSPSTAAIPPRQDELSGAAAASPQLSATCPDSPQRPPGTTPAPRVATRYSDGAPIIAGTAAAQMEAIAAATAARISGFADDDNDCGGFDGIIDAVASLG